MKKLKLPKRKQCLGKKKYEKAGEAKEAAYHLRKKDGAWMNAYLCPHCGGWHVGHTPSRVKQSIIAKHKNETL